MSIAAQIRSTSTVTCPSSLQQGRMIDTYGTDSSDGSASATATGTTAPGVHWFRSHM